MLHFSRPESGISPIHARNGLGPRHKIIGAGLAGGFDFWIDPGGELVPPYDLGGLPHFRRISQNKLDLLTFQFDKWGGFVLYLAIGHVEGFTTHWGKSIPPEKLNPSYDLGDKMRIQPGESASAES